MKIARGVYQYTAIDDCSRFRGLVIYLRRNARNTLLFLDRVVEEMSLLIQRIQTDRGGEFFAESVQRRLMNECIKFRPIPPRSQHLNGKVRTLAADRPERVLVPPCPDRARHDFPVAPNLLQHDFAVSAPDKAWCGDITYIATDEGGLYLARLKDLYSGEIVG
jgi:transposase InsO family protein